jgi:hypothetical protein
MEKRNDEKFIHRRQKFFYRVAQGCYRAVTLLEMFAEPKAGRGTSPKFILWQIA